MIGLLNRAGMTLQLFLPELLFIAGFILLKNRKKAFFIYTVIVVFLFSLLFKYTEYDDLNSYFGAIDVFRRIGFTYGSNISTNLQLQFEGTILCNGFMYLLSFLPDFLVKTIPPVFIYTVIWNTNSIRAEQDETQCSLNKSFLITVLIINLYSAISSWHYMMAIALFTNIMIRERRARRLKIFYWIGYVALCFFHSVCVVLLLFKISQVCLRKFNLIKTIFPVVCLFWKSLINSGLQLLENLGDGYFMYLYKKLNYYGNFEGTESLQLFYLVSLVLFLASCLFYVYYNRVDEEKYNIGFVIACAAFYALGSLNQLNIVFRFTYFSAMIVPIYFDLESVDSPAKIIYKRNIPLYLIVIIMSMALSLTQYYVFCR